MTSETFKENLSSSQAQTIEKNVRDNLSEIANTDLGRALVADAFNETVQVVGKNKVGPNDKCPCGSGKKLKNCHGEAA